MRIRLAEPRGFCAGVVRAIEIVERALTLHGAPVYVRHEIVHNRHVVEDLRAKGAVFVNELDEVPQGALTIFSAHGVAREVERAADARGLDVLDATCPLVTKVHVEGRRYAKDGRAVILIGHDGHPEVEGTLGQIDGEIPLVADVADVAALPIAPDRRVAYVTQTTLSVDDTREVIEAIKARFADVVGPGTRDICYATQNRQTAVRDLATQCEVVLVVGAANSSNSNRLREIAEECGAPSRQHRSAVQRQSRAAEQQRHRGGHHVVPVWSPESGVWSKAARARARLRSPDSRLRTASSPVDGPSPAPGEGPADDEEDARQGPAVGQRLRVRRRVRPAAGGMVREHGPRAHPRRRVLHLGWLRQLRQLPAGAQGDGALLLAGDHLDQGAPGPDAQGLHGQPRMVLLRLARGRGPPLLRPQQRAGHVVGQEGESERDGSLDREARRTRATGDGILLAPGRERARPVRRERLDAHRGGDDRAAGVPDGTGPAVLRCHRAALGEVHGPQGGAAWNAGRGPCAQRGPLIRPRRPSGSGGTCGTRRPDHAACR
ncbi:4-hydroxy-3-methylbut-2-enyl diphosphate reductase [Leptolyngbya sp. 15MV]|nr:4-hydroxy-3-methylbut-2-enyl diphosphate reductase [Leptolyngbya sp. 15MV]